MRGRSGEGALSMQPSTCNVSQYSHIFHFMCDLLGFYWSCNNKRNLRCVACYILALHSTLPSPLCPPLFHFATRHFLWLISLIACGLRKLVKIFLLAPNVAAPATPTPPLSARLSMLCYLQHSLNVCFAPVNSLTQLSSILWQSLAKVFVTHSCQTCLNMPQQQTPLLVVCCRLS